MKKKKIIFVALGGVKIIVVIFRGVCNLFYKMRGGQYFAAEGRKIEGPALEMFLTASLRDLKDILTFLLLIVEW